MKQKQLNFSLIIPSYNNETTIKEQLNACEKILKEYCKDYEIIVADDCSSDKTRNILLKFFKPKREYRIVFNKINLGITRNMHQIYTLAKKDFIILYSADGDWDPNDVKHLIETLLHDHADIVIGKREKKIGYTPYRHIVSFFHKLLPIILFGVNTIDPGGIKIIKKDLAQIKLTSNSQFFEAEMIIRAKKKNYKVSWYPINYKKTNYGSGSGGKLHDALESVYDAIRLRFSL